MSLKTYKSLIRIALIINNHISQNIYTLIEQTSVLLLYIILLFPEIVINEDL